MEYDAKKGEIRSDKILNELDRFTISFIKIIERYTEYVIVSGYVAIILGRTRGSEDVDLLIPKMGFFLFKKIFYELNDNGFECTNTSNAEEAYDMLNEHAIRFHKGGMPLPTMEFKVITNKIQEEALKNRIKIILKEKILYISPLELQIAYKLSLMRNMDFEDISSDKDFEDAKHIYHYFYNNLNKEKLLYFINLFKVKKEWEWLQK